MILPASEGVNRAVLLPRGVHRMTCRLWRVSGAGPVQPSVHAAAACSSPRCAPSSDRRHLADQHQPLYRGFPLRQFALGFWQFDDVLGGVAECDQRFPARQ
jgi:hypothetical protein